MYGYTLDRKEGLDAVPLNITVTTERMLEETLKNLPLKTYRKAIDALRSAGIVIGSSEMGLTEKSTMRSHRKSRKRGAARSPTGSLRQARTRYFIPWMI